MPRRALVVVPVLLTAAATAAALTFVPAAGARVPAGAGTVVTHSAASTHASPAHGSPTMSLAAASKPLPTHDPFYRYHGRKGPLRKLAPGTVLKRRTVNVSLGQSATPVPAIQLLYRTRNERKKPSVTVTTVLTPSGSLAVPRIVSYLSFYDALGSECDPSYTLTGGYAGTSSNEQQAQEEEAILSTYVNEGVIVSIPDYEGTHLHWAAGQESGYNTLDSVRATERALKLARSTPVGLTGYSGGSIAADWASELAPRYSPKLNLVGVAEGGIPADMLHNLRYINGKKTWSGVIPAVLVSIGKRAFGMKLKPFLDAKGRRITHRVRNQCIGSFSDSYPGLTMQSLLKPRYRHLLADRFFVHIVNKLLMGSAAGHPQEPLFMAVGRDDGRGDGIMVAKDVQGLAHEYCTQGVKVKFSMYTKDSHTQAAVPFEGGALQFLQQRLDGVPFQSESCASIGKGNSLHKVHRHRRHH
jgi:hypothetical protein